MHGGGRKALPARILAALVLAIGLAPLALALAGGEAPANRWREFSAALAMSGFALLLLQFVLSGRFFVLSGDAGIDVVMRLHQLVARTLFAFLLIHPFLYAAPRLFSARGGAGDLLLMLFQSGRLRTGVIAWLLLIVLMGMAIWRDRLPLRYETWRLTHGLGAGIVAALGLHHTLTAGTYSAAPALTALWLLLSLVALGSLAVVYLLRPLYKIQSPYRVTIVEPAAVRTWRIVIEPEKADAIVFRAGQFVWLNLGNSPFSLAENPFSISSAPSMRPKIEFIVKESGDFTNRIGAIEAGTTAYVDGPHGNFVLPASLDKPVVFIAGGVGIAPVLAMLRALEQSGATTPVSLIYGNRIADQIVARGELEALCGKIGLRLHLVLSEPPPGWTGPVGQMTRDVLAECLGPVDAGTVFYVCGPLPMMDSVESSLKSLGVPAGQIVTERFRYD